MIKEGTKVKWSWGNGSATGKVEKIYHKDISRTINGNGVKREANDKSPAYYIKQEDGQAVLKSASEVERA